MALHTYQGNDGNWNTAATWINGVPVGGGHVLFPETISVPLTTGPSGANQNVKLGSFTVRGFRPPIGSSGSPIEISAAKIDLQPVGNFYFACDNGGAANKTDEIIVRVPEGVNAGQVIELGAAAAAGEIDYIRVLRGNVTITNATGINELSLDRLKNNGDAVVVVNSGTGTIALVTVKNGKLDCNATITDLFAMGGAYVRQLLNTITNLRQGGSSVVEFNTAGTITRADVGDNATLDLTRDSLVKTITKLITTGDSKFHQFNDTSLHTITTWNDERIKLAA